MKERGAHRVWVCTLLDKPHKRRAPLEADFTGFRAGDEFLVGYGLDWAHRFRGLPYIGVVEKQAGQARRLRTARVPLATGSYAIAVCSWLAMAVTTFVPRPVPRMAAGAVSSRRRHPRPRSSARPSPRRRSDHADLAARCRADRRICRRW